MFFIENVVQKKNFKSCRIFWSSRNFYEKKVGSFFGHFLCFFKSLKKNRIKFKKSILKFFQIQKVSWSKNVLHDIDFLFLTSEWWYQRYSWQISIFFSEKLQFLHFFGLKILWTLDEFGRKWVQNHGFGPKPCLEPFRVTKVDHFSLFDHKKIMILSQVRNRFLVLMDFGHLCCFYTGFLYSSLQSLLWGLIWSKKTFFGSRFFGRRGWGVWGGLEPTVQKGQVRPKTHPKSLVCASERYNRKYPQVRSLYIFGPVAEIISVVSQTEDDLKIFYMALKFKNPLKNSKNHGFLKEHSGAPPRYLLRKRTKIRFSGHIIW